MPKTALTSSGQNYTYVQYILSFLPLARCQSEKSSPSGSNYSVQKILTSLSCCLKALSKRMATYYVRNARSVRDNRQDGGRLRSNSICGSRWSAGLFSFKFETSSRERLIKTGIWLLLQANNMLLLSCFGIR